MSSLVVFFAAVVSRCMLRSRSERSSVIVASNFLDSASRVAVVFTVCTTCRTSGSAANAAIMALADLALRSTEGAGVGVGGPVAGAGFGGAPLVHAWTANEH